MGMIISGINTGGTRLLSLQEEVTRPVFLYIHLETSYDKIYYVFVIRPYYTVI
jgi:hypothetical protein